MKSVLEQLRALRAEVGYSAFDHAVKQLNRERLGNRDREKRKRFPPKMYQMLFDRQQGKCPYCPDLLLIPARRNVIDHFDPNAADFNASANLRLAHAGCNSSKGALTPSEYAKRINRPLVDLTNIEEEIE